MSEFQKMSTVDLLNAINSANPWFVLFYSRNFVTVQSSLIKNKF